MAFSSLNRNSANDFANSVLPTPVVPKNINEPIGRLGSCKPARLLRTASAIASMASFWPATRLPNSSSNFNNFSRSLCSILATGIPVHLATTSAMSSAVTSSFITVPCFCSSSNWFCSPSSFCSLSRILP